jgi:ABC-2 type transport system permease protein
MITAIQTMFQAGLKDKISLGYALIFPIGLLIGLGIAFPAPTYRLMLLGSMLVFGSLMYAIGTAHEVLAQRSQGVYKLLRVTPFRTSAFITSLVIARGAVTLLTSLAVFATGVLCFGLSVPALSWLLILPVLVLGIALFSFLGFFVTNLSKDPGQVTALSNLLTFPMFFLSDSFYSLAKAPHWIQIVSKCLPVSYLLKATRAALAGDAAAMILPLLVVAGFTVLAAGLAVVTFRWDPEVRIGLRFNQA